MKLNAPPIIFTEQRSYGILGDSERNEDYMQREPCRFHRNHLYFRQYQQTSHNFH